MYLFVQIIFICTSLQIVKQQKRQRKQLNIIKEVNLSDNHQYKNKFANKIYKQLINQLNELELICNQNSNASTDTTDEEDQFELFFQFINSKENLSYQNACNASKVLKEAGIEIRDEEQVNKLCKRLFKLLLLNSNED